MGGHHKNEKNNSLQDAYLIVKSMVLFNNYDSVISQNMFFTILFAQRCADSCINHCFYYVFQAWEELNGYAILCIALFLQ